MSQLEHLTRVKNNIGDLVEEFVKWRWSTNQPRFYMRSLHDFIFHRTNTAPASPDRVLRQLRAQGRINYKVIDRKASCYLLIEGKYEGKAKRVTLLHRGVAVDHFEATGKRFRLPAHVIDHIFASNDFELEVA